MKQVMWTTALSTILMVSTTVPGQTRSNKIIDIPAQSLGSAIDELSVETGLSVVVEEGLVEGKESRAVNGKLTSQQALKAMLIGSGLHIIELPNRTFTLTEEVASTQDAEVELDRVTIQGQSDAASGTRTLGTPPPPFAGGQVSQGSRIGLLGNRDVLDTPVSVISFTDEFVQNTQAEAASDILRFEPGANIAQSPTGRGAFADSQGTLRGFTVFSGQATIDGLPGLINEVDSLTAFERVEIIRGASALLTGQVSDDAIGGSLNYVPKRALDKSLNRVTLGYRSDSNLGAEVDISRRFGEKDKFGARFAGAVRNGETSIEDSELEIGDFALSLDYRGDKIRATLDTAFESRESTFDVLVFGQGFEIPSPPDTEQFVTPFPGVSDSRSARILGTVEYDFTENWTLGLKAGYADTEFLFSPTTSAFVVNAAGDTDFDSAGFLEDQTEAFAGEASLRGEFNTGPLKHQVSFTATYQSSELTQFEGPFTSFPSNNIFNPVPASVPPNTLGPDDLDSITDTQITNIAFADSISFFDDRVFFLGGIRFTDIQIEQEDATGAVINDFDDSAFTPAFGLAVKPIEKLTLYANYIEALIPGETAPDLAVIVNSGETLPPFLSEQIEVGAKYDFGKVAATFAAFRIEQPSGLVGPDFVFAESGLQRNRGLEFSVYGEPVKGFRFIGSAGLIDSEFVAAQDPGIIGNEAPGVPNFTFSAYAELDVPQIEGLTLTGAAFFTSESFLDDTNNQEIPSFQTFDIGARYTREIQGTPVTARLLVQNVGNSEHFVSNALGFGLATPSTPRRILATISADF